MGIVIRVTDGPMTGKEFNFDEHDIFLFGRDKDCHCCLPNDSYISRHHFLLEVNPPECRIKDLQSLNGTYVNNIKHGGRESSNPVNIQEAQKNAVGIDINNGDIIHVGRTRMQVLITKDLNNPVWCVKCNMPIQSNEKEYYVYIGGTYLCRNCRPDVKSQNRLYNKEINIVNNPKKEEKSAGVLLDEMLEMLYGQNSSGKAAVPRIMGYEFIKELGRGGFGKVYLVNRLRDNKKLAMKLMLAKKKEVVDKDIALFRQEMSNTMKLSHPNIVAFEEQDYIDGIFYFTMEYCSGGCLRDIIKKHNGVVDLNTALPLMFQILDGLTYLHKNNYVHRDLKPDNILLDKTQKIAKIADLGLANNFQKTGLGGFTVPINFAGTPHYMPKEQVTNFKNVKPASDVFSIGATFYKMLTGNYVYNFKGTKDPITVILNNSTIPILKRNWMIPKSIAKVINKAISPNLKHRYQNAEEFSYALYTAL